MPLPRYDAITVALPLAHVLCFIEGVLGLSSQEQVAMQLSHLGRYLINQRNIGCEIRFQNCPNLIFYLDVARRFGR